MEINIKELTEFAKYYFKKIGNKDSYTFEDVRDALRAGAKWMAEQYELVHDENCAVPDERGGYWPTQIKLYRKKEE